jgi:hypothetical protein
VTKTTETRLDELLDFALAVSKFARARARDAEMARLADYADAVLRGDGKEHVAAVIAARGMGRAGGAGAAP